MFFWSPRAMFSPARASAVFSTLSLSPVSELSFTFSEKFSKMRPSAATRSPASSSRISPGTSCATGSSVRWPPRNTLALGEAMAFRLARDFSALKYCTVPSAAFKRSTAKMTAVLSAWPDSMEMPAAAIRMTTRRSLNCSKNTAAADFFLPSCSWFGPCSRRRSSACAALRPCGEAERLCSACCGVWEKKGFVMRCPPDSMMGFE